MTQTRIVSLTFYKWETKCGGLEASDARRLKALGDEKTKPKKLLADGRRIKMVMLAAKPEAAGHIQVVYEFSERRACTAHGTDRTAAVRYGAIGTTVRQHAHSCASWRSFADSSAYRRLHLLLRRGGIVTNPKKARRLCREERLQMRRRSCRKRAIRQARIALPQGRDQRWSLDFLSDAEAAPAIGTIRPF